MGLPVDAHDGGGTYRLANTSFFVALATGDTVGRPRRARCAPDRRHRRAVRPGPDGHRAHRRRPRRGGAADRRRLDRGGTDGWTEHRRPLYTIWPEGMGLGESTTCAFHQPEPGLDMARDCPPRRPGARATHRDRLRARHHGTPGFADYWAPEDPEWAARGITDAERLAFIRASPARTHAWRPPSERSARQRPALHRAAQRSRPEDPPPLDGPAPRRGSRACSSGCRVRRHGPGGPLDEVQRVRSLRSRRAARPSAWVLLLLLGAGVGVVLAAGDGLPLLHDIGLVRLVAQQVRLGLGRSPRALVDVGLGVQLALLFLQIRQGTSSRGSAMARSSSQGRGGGPGADLSVSPSVAQQDADLDGWDRSGRKCPGHHRARVAGRPWRTRSSGSCGTAASSWQLVDPAGGPGIRASAETPTGRP